MEKMSLYNLESKQFGCSHITVKKLECYLNFITNLICFPKQFLDLFFPNTIFLDVTSQLLAWNKKRPKEVNKSNSTPPFVVLGGQSMPSQKI